MTIASTATSAQFLRNGTTTQWSYPNKIFSAADLVVNDLDTSVPPIATPLVLNTDYTVSNIDVDTGCLVTTTLPGTAGHTLDVRSNITQLQATSIKNQGSFLPELHEEFFDRITREVQDLTRKTYTYGIHGPDQEASPWTALPPAATRKNSGLVFDNNGNPTVGSIPTVVFTQSIWDAYLAATLNFFPGTTSGRTPSEIAASITPTNYRYEEGNVLRYGADRTGAASSVAAIQAAIAVACYAGGASGIGNHSRVYFPHGTYKVDATNVFVNPTTLQRGIIFEGDGISSSTIMLTTGGAATIWMFNPGAGEQQYISVLFRDLMIAGDATGTTPNPLANGFLWYQSQGWRFTNVWFNNMGSVFEDFGNANGDSLKCVTCKATNIGTRVFLMSNNQSLNNEFFGCDFETIYGNVFEVAVGGGGALRVYGGSYIMEDGGSAKYLLNINGGGLGNSNNTYTFFGLQTEQHAANCRLVLCGSVGAQSPHIVFHECNFTCTNGAREQVNVINCHVVFDKCVMTQDQGNTYTCQGPVAGGGDQYGEPGSIRYIGCEVPINFSTFQSTPVDAGDSIAWGYISARDCFWSNYDSGVARTVRTAIDFDLNWQNQGRASNFVGLKKMIGKPLARQWCDSTANFNWTITLPNNALIVKIIVYRAATATNAAYTLLVGNSGTPALYGTSGVSNCNLAQTISVDFSATPASWVNAGTTSPGNQVQVSATTAATGAGAVGSIGYFIVEYY